jgi:orotidine-5'-phosphate decarboxylase
MEMNDPREHLIVALDVSSSTQALELVELLKGRVGYFKVGLQLFISAGPAMVERILDRNCKVFLDLKLHDIPNTVSNAIGSALSMGVSMLTLHTIGGEMMLRRAAETVANAAARSLDIPKLLGVTILTSMDERQVRGVGLESPIEGLVLRLAHLADDCGLDGIVCSPQELNRLRGESFQRIFFVTPGIRPEGAQKDDQYRTNTPSDAIRMGAHHLVVGRPVTKAEDPARAAEAIVEEIQRAKIEAE